MIVPNATLVQQEDTPLMKRPSVCLVLQAPILFNIFPTAWIAGLAAFRRLVLAAVLAVILDG